jgi:hypothetical protein
MSSSRTSIANLRTPSISAVLALGRRRLAAEGDLLGLLGQVEGGDGVLAHGLLIFRVQFGYLSLMILPMRTWVSSSGTSSSSNRPRSMVVLSCTKVAITSFRSSWQMRGFLALGFGRPLISIWNCPVCSLKPTLHLSGS